MGTFELKFLPETQSTLSFLESEIPVVETLRNNRKLIDEADVHAHAHSQTQGPGPTPSPTDALDLVIKVSVPDWKVMAFSNKLDGQLIWEHQVMTAVEDACPKSFVARPVQESVFKNDFYQ